MRAKQIMKIFQDTAYVRTGGSEMELRTAQYLADACAKIGLQAKIEKFDVDMASTGGTIALGRKGCVVDFSEETAKAVLAEEEIQILINLDEGNESAVAWGCDLTYDYVKINGDYRS